MAPEGRGDDRRPKPTRACPLGRQFQWGGSLKLLDICHMWRDIRGVRSLRHGAGGWGEFSHGKGGSNSAGRYLAAGVSEILPEEGVYRRHFECTVFRIREDGIRNPGAGATERRVEAELLASNHDGILGRDPGPNSLAR